MTDNNAKEVVWDLPHTFLFKDQSVRFGVIGSGRPLVFVHGTQKWLGLFEQAFPIYKWNPAIG